MSLKTRREARIWVYRSCVAHSLRRKAQALTAACISADATPGAVKRVRAEMLALADWLERRAARLEAKAPAEHYQPKTGEACACKPGMERDNCPACEGTGQRIDFAAIRASIRARTA